ncbi:hypothetical protein GCM10010430_50950 [Kitasatospora cystarginea]|uniref:Uncharacterized protein n=1 Tax=Kitasatospora cystarginea TaxID=58350 RepID=A0ABP5RGU0_9ACTN
MNPSGHGTTRHLAVAVREQGRHQLLHRFATWHQLRRLRAKPDAGPLGRSPTHEARQQITQADAFLTWLVARNRTLDQCQQDDLDAWHADQCATRRPAQPFLRWCMDNSAMPRLALPDDLARARVHDVGPAMTTGGASTEPARTRVCAVLANDGRVRLLHWGSVRFVGTAAGSARASRSAGRTDFVLERLPHRVVSPTRGGAAR